MPVHRRLLTPDRLIWLLQHAASVDERVVHLRTKLHDKVAELEAMSVCALVVAVPPRTVKHCD